MKSYKRHRLSNLLVSTLALLIFIQGSVAGQAYSAQAGERTFSETGKRVQGRFLEYWEKNGGLPQQGYPISGEMQEKSETDGKTYAVQYFERAVFELHPENAPPNDVLLSLLGVFLYGQKYPGGAPNQTPNNQAGSRLFSETGKRVGGVFLDYWTRNGGLAQQGFPISDEFNEVSDLDGKTYKVQYFQRAVFEYHPENKAPYDVLLSQLGTFRYRAKYLQSATPIPGSPTAVPPAEASPTPSSIAIPQPPEYAAVRARYENMTPEQWRAAGYTDGGYGCARGIGVRLLHSTLEAQAFGEIPPDPQTPPVLYANRTMQRIVGLQWVAPRNQPPPVLFGQQMSIFTPPATGATPLYGLFSFFKPNGHVLFARLDPDDPCSR